MNLYSVTDKTYDWCCYVFATTRGRAKALGASYIGVDYIDARCSTLKRGVNFSQEMVVDDTDSPGYEMVLKCGYEFADEEEYL